MAIEITLKNYRCFPRNYPARITLREGFTSFVGVNNSGKSTVLRFFYEFRDMFRLFQPLHNEFIHACNPSTPRQFSLPSSVQDASSLHNDLNSGELDIEIRLIDSTNDGIADKALITVLKNTNQYFIQLFANNRALGSKPISWEGTPDAPILRNRETLGMDVSRLFNEIAAMAGAFYIGPFRNTVHLGGPGTPYYDIAIGEAFIAKWRAWKTGNDRAKNVVIRTLTEDLRELFGFRSLDINASDDNRSLKLFVNNQPYQLDELGSGLAQFIVVLGNAAIRQSDYILIDEPELNLHPSLQARFLTALGKYAARGVLFSTHSYGLARVCSEYIYTVTGVEHGRSTIAPLERTTKLPELLSELSFSGYRELGFDKILLVEGPTEVKVFQQLLRKYNKDGKIILINLGGSSMICAGRDSELEELKRIVPTIFALIDSERETEDPKLDGSRAAFAKSCRACDIDCKILDRRATENYFTDRAIKESLKSDMYSELKPFEKLKDKNGWDKSQNWKIAAAMTREELDASDLGEFLARI